ncbi:MAG: ABC transporter ATP-binding protein [Actinobacteria bacterium]|nr:ABC transporter ATP-binding protein [Actinomycetota bacterium]
MASIELKNVTVDLPIFGAHNMNLKGRFANFLARRESAIEVIRALHLVSLSVQDGDRIGIVGPNGAGKTTLLRVMAGILKPSQGEVTIQGTVVSMIDQSLGMDPQCSGLENIFRRGIFLNQNTQQMQGRVNDIVEFSGLGARIRHPLYTYSSGMRARLAFSIATSIEPEILIIDEGIGAADEEFSERASVRLDAFLKNAGILLLASHSNQLIESWCNKKIHINTGLLMPSNN